jgi:hypothetical protein
MFLKKKDSFLFQFLKDMLKNALLIGILPWKVGKNETHTAEITIMFSKHNL